MAYWEYKFFFRASDTDTFRGYYDMTEWIPGDENVSTYEQQEALVSQWCRSNNLNYLPGSAQFQGMGHVDN
jgi:hypothetical protein